MQAYYRLDRELRITDVGGDWDSFATEASADECVSRYVTGTHLFSYILGDATRAWIETIIRVARIEGTVQHRIYRCDAPARRCYFDLKVESGKDGSVTLSHELQRSEPMRTTVNILPDQDDAAAIPRCSICNFLKLDGAWRDPFELGRDLKLHVTYDVCDRCQGGRSVEYRDRTT